jgi:hypothetical protein
MSEALPILAMEAGQAAQIFATYAEILTPVSFAGDVGSVGGFKVLIVPVSLREADGVVVKPGDDRIFVMASDLASVGVPKIGDTFTSATSGVVWTVVACEVSPGGTLYTVFGRRT